MPRTRFLVAALATLVVAALPAFAGGPAKRVENAIWAHGAIYDTAVTQNSFDSPPSHTVDRLYNFSMSGLMGQRSVSEAAPGDTDYNGGRWHVQMVVFTESGIAAFDPDGDGYVNGELISAEEVLEEVEMGHLEVYPTMTFFSCPLLPTL